MKVYRYLSANELEKIQSGNVKELGTSFADLQKRFGYATNPQDSMSTTENNIKMPNNYHYSKDKKYIHFFLSKSSCKYLIDLDKDESTQDGLIKDHYIATFNIPIVQLIKHRGKGFYGSINQKPVHSYENEPPTEIRREFAVDMDVFNPEWLTDYEPAYIDNVKNKRKNNESTREL